MKGRRNWIIEFFRLGDAGTGRHGREMPERTEIPMESEMGRRNEAQQTVQRWERLEHGEKRRMDHRKEERKVQARPGNDASGLCLCVY